MHAARVTAHSASADIIHNNGVLIGLAQPKDRMAQRQVVLLSCDSHIGAW